MKLSKIGHKTSVRRNIKPCAVNMREVLGGLQNHIRYALMDSKYFADRVAVDDILSTEEKLHLSRSLLGNDSLGTTCFKKTARKPLFQKKRSVKVFQPGFALPYGVKHTCYRI